MNEKNKRIKKYLITSYMMKFYNVIFISHIDIEIGNLLLVHY